MKIYRDGDYIMASNSIHNEYEYIANINSENDYNVLAMSYYLYVDYKDLEKYIISHDNYIAFKKYNNEKLAPLIIGEV